MRFHSDGGKLGFGAKIGISTDKYPCLPPMNLHEFTSYKYRGLGNGHVRGGKAFPSKCVQIGRREILS